MNKNYILTLLMTLCLTVASFGQEMMLNGGLENWTTGTNPTDWTTAQNITQESSEKHGGSFSAKQTKDASGGYKKLNQNIPNTTVGESYTVSFWYKIAPDAGSVVKMWSNFRDTDGTFLDGTTDNITLPVNGNVWTKYEETVTAPLTSVKFWFEVRTYNNTTVYFDDFSFVRNPFTWTGAANSNFNDAANWSTNAVPSENYDIIIPSSATINMPATLTVNSMSIAAGASIISTGTITGPISYTRTIPTTNWYLISSPVAGQDKDAFVTASNLATGTTGNNVGFADYDNSTGAWSYYQSGASGTGNFVLGEGHAVKKANTAGDVVFTGTFNDADASIAVSNATEYNLIGNPYLASVSVIEMLGEANNATLLSEKTIWLWDQKTSSYGEKNLLNDLEIAPGQAFFVSAAQTGNFSIKESMQNHNNEDTFQKTTTRPEVALTLSNGAASRIASIFYIDGATTGFDNGYDSSIFGGLANEFSIFTHAVANGSGRNLGTQSLPDNNFENMIVPVGVIAESGSALEFSARLENLPEGIKVFLEDKEENTFTRLDALDASHKITTTSIINGVGRFYLHTAKSVLGIADATLDNISVFTVNNSLRIVGLQQGKASVKLFNILGKQVLNAAFESNGMKDISLPRLTKGIYIVQLETAEGTLNKKIILE
jgi:hypothetical protein